MKHLYLAALACLLSSTALAEQPKFETSCKVILVGMTSSTTLSVRSEEYEIAEATMKSKAQVNFGNFTVMAQLAAEDISSPPTLFISFFKGDNAESDSISSSYIRGLNFLAWELGRSNSIGSSSIGLVEYNGSSFMQVKYSCGVTRVK